jgi:predicted DNA-binding transcriptional regulator YafY
MKQMDRRLLILMRLRDELPVRAADLAEECGCSVRTIYRDIDALSQSGVPVAAMPGEGYRMVEGYHLPPVAFTAEEAVQLLLGADLAVGLGTAAQREAARTAAAKVEAVLQPETRREVDLFRDRIRVSPWMRQEASPWLPLLHEGVVTERVMRLRYYSFSAEETTERDVEPYYLTFYGGDWHLVAYCRMRDGMRDFRASRIRHADLLSERFEREDLPQHPPDREHHPPQEVRIWIESAALPWAREQPAYGFRGEEPSEGGAVFVFHVWEIRRILPWVLGWGASARVLSPGDAVERVRREAEALAHAYAEE